jgi:hypothetical protein
VIALLNRLLFAMIYIQDTTVGRIDDIDSNMQAKQRVASSTSAGICPYAVMGAARNAPAKLGKAEDEDNERRESILISGAAQQKMGIVDE